MSDDKAYVLRTGLPQHDFGLPSLDQVLGEKSAIGADRRAADDELLRFVDEEDFVVVARWQAGADHR
ncbi:hypothetical protein [Petropleomorpha daqingensis]|uniref:Uncharacterized protein n=1 Tax=Petropleomorpha daqingensis TaxID=2026353 RepID=A0A853CIS3_9ACTN|nr:hypothetical protein [Petropleomorpha daqingensis]NYJ07216.1 hypothetical protein [Petropleomorpha daqingensis]